MWPFHLVSLGVLTAAGIAGAIGADMVGLDPTGLLLALGGVELIFLSSVAKSRRFRRAINAKYGRELQTYSYLKQMTDTYNELSPDSQRRFEQLRLQVSEAKKNYSRLHTNFPDLVKEYVGKMDALQINFVRLLAKYENYPQLLEDNRPDRINEQIQKIKGSMRGDHETLRSIKEKRIGLLEARIKKYYDSSRTYQSLREQMQTIEEMARFYAEQHSMTSAGTDEIRAIDQLISETNHLHDTLGVVDQIMRSDLQTPVTMDNQMSGSGASSAGLYAE